MARLLAMALNCSAAEAATPDPCGTCSTCRAVADGSSLDVIEVDAASHNGVDDVREIRERVAHLPASSRFKVYILDEAHMFSTAAWNAFLKTLEEPPAHARFVFATTEPEKVPDTILSRCQRYDFRRIQARDIVRTLRTIVERESEERETPIEAGDAALAALARAAHGGLRDAESLLEQAILAGDGRVREEDLAALLGTVPREMVRAVLERAAAGDAAGTLAAYARVHEAGGDAASFLGQALEMLRELTAVAVAGADTPVVDAEDAERASLAALAKTFGASGTLRATQALAEALRLVRATGEERPLVEAGLLRVALQGSGRTIPEVLDALAAMEARLSGEGTAAGPQRNSEAPAPPRPGEAAVPEKGTAAPASALPAPDLPASGGALFGEERPQRPGPNAGDPSAVLTLDRVRQEWPRVLEEAKGRAPTLATFLAPARPLVLAEDSLTLAFPSNMAFHRSQCEDEGRRKALDEVLALVFGRRLRPIFETAAADAEPAKPAPGEGPEAAPSEAKEFDRLRTEEIEALQSGPAGRALEREFKVKMVKVGRRRGAEAAGAGSEAEGTEERE
jgi:DNA polymerase-3 subunit gamma/tau